MNSKYKDLLKNTAIFALGSLGSKVILFFLVPLYTNFLSTAEYGIADLTSTFSQLLMPITSLMISSAVIRFGMMKGENPEDVALVSFVVIGLSTVATISTIPILSLYDPIREWKLYLVAQIVFGNIVEVEKTYLKVKNRNKLFSIISIVQTTILAGVNILLLTVLRLGIRGYLMANVAASAVGSILAFASGGLYRDLRHGRFDAGLLLRMLKYSVPLIFSNISWWFVHSSDKIMIEAMIGASSLGLYVAASKIPSLINVMIGIFNQAWGISSIKEIESTNERSFYSSVFNLFSTFLFVSCNIFIALIKPFMDIYVGNDFKGAWTYTPFLLAAAVFYSVSALIGTLYSALRKTKNDMWTTVLCAAVNVVVNYCGIKAFGVWGAIAGTLCAYLTIATVRLFDIKRLMDFTISPAFWVNTLVLLLHAMAVTTQWHSFVVSFLSLLTVVIINRSELFVIVGAASNFLFGKSSDG